MVATLFQFNPYWRAVPCQFNSPASQIQTKANATHRWAGSRNLTTARGPFDVILDAAAAYRWSQWKTLLKPGGTFVTTLPSLPFILDWLTSSVSSTRTRMAAAKSRPADLQLLGEWLAAGLEVPLDSTIPVTGVAVGLMRLKGGGVVGRVAVDVLNRFEK